MKHNRRKRRARDLISQLVDMLELPEGKRTRHTFTREQLEQMVIKVSRIQTRLRIFIEAEKGEVQHAQAHES